MALDGAWYNRTRYLKNEGAGDYSTIIKKPETPKQVDMPSATVSKVFGGVAKGWAPAPAVTAASYVLSDPRATPAKLERSTAYYVDCQSVQQMSYVDPSLRARFSDGIRGEAEPVVPKFAIGATHRSIGGHEAWPNDGLLNMLK